MSDLLKQLGYVPEHEFAAAIGIEVGTLRNWRAKGLGPDYNRAGGGQIVYAVEAIREWLADNLVTPEPLPSMVDAERRPGRPRKTAAA